MATPVVGRCGKPIVSYSAAAAVRRMLLCACSKSAAGRVRVRCCAPRGRYAARGCRVTGWHLSLPLPPSLSLSDSALTLGVRTPPSPRLPARLRHASLRTLALPCRPGPGRRGAALPVTQGQESVERLPRLYAPSLLRACPDSSESAPSRAAASAPSMHRVLSKSAPSLLRAASGSASSDSERFCSTTSTAPNASESAPSPRVFGVSSACEQSVITSSALDLERRKWN